jgi:transmembrane 9 superfamily member 2/4
VPTLVYFATVFDACLIFFLCTGTIGFLSSYYFVIKIYGAVKVD